MPDDQAFFNKTRTQKYWDLEKREEIGFITWDHEDIMRGKQLVCNKAKGEISKRSPSNFQKNEHFLPPDTQTYVCMSGVKKCSFFGKFGMLCFLKRPVSRFALLPITDELWIAVMNNLDKVWIRKDQAVKNTSWNCTIHWWNLHCYKIVVLGD